jgi:quinohemoprotein ethanol dehydrogenase
VLATASDLVFQGTAEGLLKAYDAASGDSLWSMDQKTGIIGSPVTYEVDGVQYVSIGVGWGGVHGRSTKYTENINPGTIYTLAIGGDAPFPEYQHPPKGDLVDLAYEATAEELQQGGMLYFKFCDKCHGDIGGGGGVMPDLAYSAESIYDNFHSILLEGVLEPNGMPNFRGRISEAEASNIKKFILSQVEQRRAALSASLD